MKYTKYFVILSATIILITIFVLAKDIIKYSKFGGKPKVYLNVPFYPQVSQGNPELSKLGCEESSILMAHSYYKSKQEPNPRKEMEMMIEKEKELFGAHIQIGNTKIPLLINNIYNTTSKSEYLISTNTIDKYLKDNKPVIIPVLADGLKNPLYTENGYHVIIIVGYNDYGYWTNDPGTASGSGFFYPKKTVFNSAYDIETKKKIIITLGD